MTANAVFLQFRRSASVALVLVLAVLQGCAAMSRPRAMPDDPEYAPVRAQAMMQRDLETGSIYQVSRNYNFYGDTVALNVGDVLTVTLDESTRASKNAETSISKDSDISLAGSITVTVTEVLPNGVLRIRGEKWLSLTNGEEYIRLTGLVRPQDIKPDNTLASNRIADARIAYGGTGDFDQANQMGWMGRFFNSEWWPL
ncbi:flagellar basal body L-ring protein FlgH [Marinobacter gelidimuriae]|uniref:flagellar basal body L-ring protein FlgH n=1 Tax=Marinobacter gelidimuriae TaxID=2739064 RepID=UPI00036E2481|nr:flagellar basal body L-ring protein FlgH [Marinobacter gelidimuriae]